jgi:DUF971 family protein
MSRPASVTQTGVGSSAWIPVSRDLSITSVAVTASGTVNYTVQHTFDDVFDPSVTPTVFNHSSLAAQTASGYGAYTAPVSAVRVTVNSGTGSARLVVLQAQ